MVLSYHPWFTGDMNRSCAGRAPDAADARAMQQARAIVLNQGAMAALYRMARDSGRPVFPNYHARFDFPGKVGQAQLFDRLGVPRPRTLAFLSLAAYHSQPPALPPYPLVGKLDWGGEGDTVWRLDDPSALDHFLRQVRSCERTGQSGFLLQEFIPSSGRSLRVVVIGQRLLAYWRTQDNPAEFRTNLAWGARIDDEIDPHLSRIALALAGSLCRSTGINLAGLDLLVPERTPEHPVLLEINYFFGRAGLGGSFAFYRLLVEAISAWLIDLGVTVPCQAPVSSDEDL